MKTGAKKPVDYEYLWRKFPFSTVNGFRAKFEKAEERVFTTLVFHSKLTVTCSFLLSTDNNKYPYYIGLRVTRHDKPPRTITITQVGDDLLAMWTNLLTVVDSGIGDALVSFCIENQEKSNNDQ